MKYCLVLVLLCCVVSAPVKAVKLLGETGEVALPTEFEIDGKTSVIVEYDTSSAGLNGFASAQGGARSAMIQSMHQRFMASLPADITNTASTSFSLVPGSVLTVDQEQLAQLRNNPLVKQVHKNRINRISLQESVDIVLPGSAKGKFSGKGQTIAILDTGVDRTHSFFRNNGVNRVVSEACFSAAGDASPSFVFSLCPNGSTSQLGTGSGRDCTAKNFPGCNHGTHVAGIAAGNTGVASEANIIAIQIFTGIRGRSDICGSQLNCVTASDSDIIRGLERVFALRNTYNIASVNMSLGGGRFTSTCNSRNSMVTRVIGQLKSAGIATIVASGNDGFSSSIGYPACISSAIAVGSTSDFTGTALGRSVVKDQRVFYSNHSATVDLFAPGTLIRSSVPGNGFANLNGTSMATPHVAGAFAVVKAQKNSLSVNEIESAFKAVGPNVAHAGVSRRRIDIVKALKKLGLIESVFAMSPVLSMLFDEFGPPAPPTPPTMPPSGCSLRAIAPGETISTAWTGSSSFSSNRGGGNTTRSVPFVFELTATTNLTIDLLAPVDTYMYLMQGCSASGTVITFNDDGGEGLNSRIVRTLGAGIYTIDATTFSGGVTSGFSVVLSN